MGLRLNKLYGCGLVWLAMGLGGCQTSAVIEANLSTYGNVNSKAFSLSISQQSIERFSSRDRQSDKRFPLMTRGEVKVLEMLLKRKRYCYKDGKLQYNVIRRQGEVFEDMVYKYKGNEYRQQRGVAPVTYYGKCL